MGGGGSIGKIAGGSVGGPFNPFNPKGLMPGGSSHMSGFAKGITGDIISRLTAGRPAGGLMPPIGSQHMTGIAKGIGPDIIAKLTAGQPTSGLVPPASPIHPEGIASGISNDVIARLASTGQPSGGFHPGRFASGLSEGLPGQFEGGLMPPIAPIHPEAITNVFRESPLVRFLRMSRGVM